MFRPVYGDSVRKRGSGRTHGADNNPFRVSLAGPTVRYLSSRKSQPCGGGKSIGPSYFFSASILLDMFLRCCKSRRYLHSSSMVLSRMYTTTANEFARLYLPFILFKLSKGHQWVRGSLQGCGYPCWRSWSERTANASLGRIWWLKGPRLT